MRCIVRCASLMTSTVGVVYQNAEVFVKILRDCGLPHVANWKPEDIKRALDWVQYFAKVNKHVASKSHVVDKLERRVKEIGRSLAVRFGQEEASFHFLVHKSLHYSLQTLLANPVLPDQLRQYILSHHSEKLTQHEAENMHEQGLLTTLSQIHGVLTDSVPDTDLALTIHSLDASYLREDISWLLQAMDSGSQRPNIVSEDVKSTAAKRLSSLAQVDGGMEVILLALLQNSSGTELITGPVQYSSMDPTRKFMLEWLVEVAQDWEKDENNDPGGAERPISNNIDKLGDFLWSRSQSKLLVKLSATYFMFFKEHLKYLISITNKLNWKFNPTCSKKKEDISKESQKWIISQWVDLVCEGEHLREVLLHVIKSRAFPRAKSEEQSQLCSELCQAGISLNFLSPIPPSCNIWVEVLKNVSMALKEQ